MAPGVVIADCGTILRWGELVRHWGGGRNGYSVRLSIS
jgi:hypothetical protein